MQDFNKFSENRNKSEDNGSVFDFVKSVAKKFDGKSEKELFTAVYNEAEKRKRAGTLSNAEVDNFVKTLSPFLDQEKRKILHKISEEIKKI